MNRFRIVHFPVEPSLFVGGGFSSFSIPSGYDIVGCSCMFCISGAYFMFSVISWSAVRLWVVFSFLRFLVVVRSSSSV